MVQEQVWFPFLFNFQFTCTELNFTTIIIIIVVSGLLTISMGRRFVATNGGLIPGIVTLISTTALVANGYAFYLL
mgnify:CR=1 FL=1